MGVGGGGAPPSPIVEGRRAGVGTALVVFEPLDSERCSNTHKHSKGNSHSKKHSNSKGNIHSNSHSNTHETGDETCGLDMV